MLYQFATSLQLKDLVSIGAVLIPLLGTVWVFSRQISKQIGNVEVGMAQIKERQVALATKQDELAEQARHEADHREKMERAYQKLSERMLVVEMKNGVKKRHPLEDTQTD